MGDERPNKQTVSLAVCGSGGAGAMTTGNLLFDTAAQLGWYGNLTRTVGPQIRGGEAAAMVRLTRRPTSSPDDCFDVLLAIDWSNAERFAPELPLGPHSLIITDSDGDPVPESIAASGAKIVAVPLSAAAKSVKKGRPNMAALGVLAEMIDLPADVLNEALSKKLAAKGDEVVQTSLDTVAAGRAVAAQLPQLVSADFARPEPGQRWVISGNEAAGLGAVRGGVRFVAAYPITPATEVLEWLAPALPKVGGCLVQAEDELSSMNMIIGASFGGVPALTATSGPGLALMIESLGLAVAAEVPVVVVDVMRGGPSTGIPTKAEQSDLNIAVYGLHGDAPHLVLAPLSADDCLFTTQWSVHLAEAMQTAAIVLSDQYIGQARVAIDKPADVAFIGQREVAERPAAGYQRYAVTASGVSPMTLPGTAGGQYTADGLEHSPRGIPSSQTEHHHEQMNKRLRKITGFDYGEHWAEVEGDGEIAVLTWGTTTGAAREAVRRLADEGIAVRLIALRLLLPLLPQKIEAALDGVQRLLVVEQNHSAQLYRHVRGYCDLPADVHVLNRPGPIAIRPGEVVDAIKAGRQS